MSEIKSLNDRKQKKSTKVLTFALGGILLALSIVSASVYGIICGVLLLLAGLFKKSTSVNEDGLLIVYNARLYKYKELWNFADIKELHAEELHGTEETALHFMRDVMSKRVIFTRQDAADVVEMARKANPCMHIDEAYYSR